MSMSLGSEDDIEKPLQIVFVPLPSPGHMNPMVALIRLLASHDVICTVITTPANASFFQNRALTRPVNIRLIPFPAQEFGLPIGLENLASITSPDMKAKIFRAMFSLQKPMEDIIQEISPDCIISDMFYPWTVDFASKLGIPRLLIHSSSILSLCCEYYVMKDKPHRRVYSNADIVAFPSLPDKIEMTVNQLPDWVRNETIYTMIKQGTKEAELRSYGILANIFEDLEPAYLDHYRAVTGLKIWPIGPFLFEDARDENAPPHWDQCLEWLNQKKPKSVLYVCFGSLVKFSDDQLREIAAGLEASGQDFLWVARRRKSNDHHDDDDDNNDNEEDDWLQKGFTERIKDQGFIIQDWAPQILILNHPAIGGMITHCGWNSLVEGITAGLPFITWPMFAEQLYNEKLVVDVLKTGVPIDVATWRDLDEDDHNKTVVGREKVEVAVRRIMGGEVGAEMRQRATEFGRAARKAVQDGGSSRIALLAFLQEMKARRAMAHGLSSSNAHVN